MYSEKVLEHFMSPRNAWLMPGADGIGTAGDPGCSDHCMVFIKVREGIIYDISFLMCGCGAAIASGSMTTVLAKGKHIKGALQITEQDVIEALDGLPEAKQHCSNLGVAALQSAIKDYLGKQGMDIATFV